MSDSWLNSQPEWEVCSGALFAQSSEQATFEESTTRSLPVFSPARGSAVPEQTVNLGSNATDLAHVPTAGSGKVVQPQKAQSTVQPSQMFSPAHSAPGSEVLLPPRAMMLSRTHFSVAVRADSRRSVSTQVDNLLQDAQLALFDMDATLEAGDNKFCLVTKVYDPRTYACVTFEVSVHSPASTTPTSAVPDTLMVDVRRWSGDAFFFGSVFSELRTLLTERAAKRAAGNADVAEIQPRSGPEAAERLAAFDCFTSPDKLAQLRKVQQTQAAPSGVPSEAVAQHTSADGAGEETDDADVDAVQPFTSEEAAAAVSELIQQLSDDSGCDFPASAACRLCEIVNDDTASGRQAPVASSMSAAVLQSSEMQQALADALEELVVSPCSAVSVPLTVAVSNLLRSPGATSVSEQLLAALRKLSTTDYFKSARVPENVQQCASDALKTKAA